MKTEHPSLGRRQFFRALGIGAVATAAGPLVTEAVADSASDEEKRKPRYKADSPEVQTYYSVNRYPKPASKGG